MNPGKYSKMTMEQIAESIKPKEKNFLTKEQLDELHKRTYDGTVEPKGHVITNTKCTLEVIEEGEEKEEDNHWWSKLGEELDKINFE